jgi:hypothetical protein
MDNAKETLEQFEKLLDGHGLAEIIEGAYREGYSDGETDVSEFHAGGRAKGSCAAWNNSDTKYSLSILTKLNGGEG